MLTVQRLIPGLVVVLLAGVGLTACKDDADETPAPVATENAGGSATASPEAEPETAPEDHADPPANAMPAGLPEGLPEIGIPFYMPAELVATPSLGDPWVLEFVTDHELTIVNNTIANEFSDANGWQGVNREVEGQQTVTQGTKDGYHLVIAVAPEPQDDFKTSMYYTLSTTG